MRTAPSAKLARQWVPERSLVSDIGLLATAAVVLPAGWRLSHSR